MKTVRNIRFRYCLFFPIWSALLLSARADLSGLKEEPSRGQHAVMETRKFTFALDAVATGKLMMPDERNKEKFTSFTLQPTISFIVEEVQPDGSTVVRRLDKASLTGKDPAFRKQGKSTFTGSVTGGTTFEGTVEFAKGVVLLGGRLVAPGPKVKGVPRFGIRIDFPPAYPYDKKAEKAEQKKFEKKTEDDRLTLVRSDGSRAKFPSSEKISPNPAAINGSGISECRWEIAAYKGRSLEFKAAPQSKLLLAATEEHTLAEGFSLTWYPDPANKPGAATLEINVR